MKQLCLLFFLTFSLLAEVSIKNEMQEIDTFELEYYYDVNKTETINSIQKINFQKTTSNWFTFGFITGNSWFKLTIENTTQTDQFVFQLIEPFFQRVNFYTEIDGIWKEQRSGLKEYEKNKNSKYLTPVFLFQIKPHTRTTIYIQFAPDKETAGSSFGRFNLATQTYFNSESIFGNYLFYFFFLGSMFIITILNLFLFLKFHDRIYFYYAMYILSLSTYLTVYTGLIHHFGLALWYRELSLSMPLLVIFLILFTNNFLKLDHYLPLIHQLLKWIAWFLLLSLPYMLYDYSNWMKTIGISTVFIAPIGAFSAIYVAYQGHKEAKFYFIGILFYIAALSILPLMTKAILPHTLLTHYSFSLFSYVEVMFFSFVLINRFYAMQNDKIKLQNELITIQNNNEKILEARVERRTDKINQLLQDKEVLLKEVYHRVKNNFQMIISLLWIENQSRKDENQDEYLLDLINRIKSMSLIHQYLLGKDDYSEIKAKTYLHQVSQEIEKTYPSDSVSIYNKIDDFGLSPNDALALGIIVNEALTNAVKHYEGDEKCLISMQCTQKENTITLTVQDNGKGFDVHKKRDSFGLKLMHEFAKKLKASQSNFTFEEGTRFTLQFEL